MHVCVGGGGGGTIFRERDIFANLPQFLVVYKLPCHTHTKSNISIFKSYVNDFYMTKFSDLFDIIIKNTRRPMHLQLHVGVLCAAVEACFSIKYISIQV